MQAASGIGLYMNSDKKEFMSFNQDGAIFSLNVQNLKLPDQFMHLGSNISSAKSDARILVDKVWTS